MGVPILGRTVPFYALARICILSSKIASIKFFSDWIVFRPIRCRYSDLQYTIRGVIFVTCRILQDFGDKGATFIRFIHFGTS